jgi:hypothetical protein
MGLYSLRRLHYRRFSAPKKVNPAIFRSRHQHLCFVLYRISPVQFTLLDSWVYEIFSSLLAVYIYFFLSHSPLDLFYGKISVLIVHHCHIQI